MFRKKKEDQNYYLIPDFRRRSWLYRLFHRPSSQEEEEWRRVVEARPRFRLNISLKIPGWAWGAAGLLVGFAAGAMIVRQRQTGRDVIVVVQGKIISAPDFYHRLEIESGPQVLNKMVNEELLLQYARKKGALPGKAEVNRRIEAVRQKGNLNTYLKQTRQSPEDFARKIQVELAEAALYGADTQVTEAEAQDYYRRQTDPHNAQARFYRPETTRLQVIVTAAESDSRKAWQEIQSGTPFTTVAQIYSRDKSASEGGMLSPLVRGRSRANQVPGFEEALFRLNPGEKFGPRPFAGAWWIVSCLEKTPATAIPFAKVETECREGARIRKGAAAKSAEVMADFEVFRQQTPVQTFWDRYLHEVTISRQQAAKEPQ